MKTIITKINLLVVLAFTTSITFATDATVILNPPENDLIENATDLSHANSTLFLDTDINFPEATTTGDGGQQGCTTGVAGVWYKFTATAVGEIGAGLTNDDSGIIVFYTAPNENVTTGQELTHVDQASNPCDNSNFALIETTTGTTYYIYIKNNIVSDVIINTEEIFAIPANDLVENAINLNGLEDYFDSDVHFLVATSDNDGGQNGCDTDPAKAVWYKFTALTDGEVVAGIGLVQGAGGVVFYTAANENATTGSDLTWVNQGSNPCGPNNLSSIEATAGTTYYLLAAAITGIPEADVSVNLSGIILGIKENVIDGFTYYPNPVSSEINLSAKSKIEEVTIYNLLGQKVFAEKPNVTRKGLDISYLQTGMYVMHVTSEGKSASYKIVKK